MITELIQNFHQIEVGNQEKLLSFYDSNFLALQQTDRLDIDKLNKLIEIRSIITSCLYSKGRFTEAIKEGLRNITLIEENEQIDNKWGFSNLLHVGYSFYQQQQYLLAKEHLKKALEIEPKNEKIQQFIKHAEEHLSSKNDKYFYITASIAFITSLFFEEQIGPIMSLTLDVIAVLSFFYPIVRTKLKK